MNRVIVTGAGGFIGAFTLPFLVQAGFEVHALSRKPNPEPVDGVLWHNIDLLQDSEVSALLTKLKATHLLHLAWYTAHGKFWHADENLDWVSSSLKLLTAFVASGGRRVVMAGSCAEYEWQQQSICSESETPCLPSTLYGVGKHALHQLAEAYCSRHGIDLVWGRVFFLYGPGEDQARFVPTVVNGLLRGEQVACSQGKQLRDFMHVRDVASAFASLLNSDLIGVVNVASGKATSLRQVGEQLTAQIGGSGSVDFGALPDRSDEPKVLTANVSRLRDELNWRPCYSLEQGLADTVIWWREHIEVVNGER